MIPTTEFPNQHKGRNHQQAFPQHPERKAQQRNNKYWKEAEQEAVYRIGKQFFVFLGNNSLLFHPLRDPR